jgi:signal transduction histidine kinase
MRHLTVYQRLAMIIAVLSIAFFAVAVAQILVLRDSVLDERRTTVRDLVEAAQKILAHYDDEAKAGRISPDQARQSAFASIGAMRWGEYSDYVGIYGAGSADAGITYVHGNPKYVNVNRWEFKDSQGRLLIQDIVRTAHSGGGFDEYLANCPMSVPTGPGTSSLRSRPALTSMTSTRSPFIARCGPPSAAWSGWPWPYWSLSGSAAASLSRSRGHAAPWTN